MSHFFLLVVMRLSTLSRQSFGAILSVQENEADVLEPLNEAILSFQLNIVIAGQKLLCSTEPPSAFMKMNERKFDGILLIQ